MTPTGSKLSPHLKKAAWAAGLGCLIVLGPWGLDRWATGRARDAVRKLVERRMGGRVTVGAVRADGPLGLRIDQVQVRWPGRGKALLALPELRVRISTADALRLRLRVKSVVIPSGRFLWRRPDALAELRKLARRLSRQGVNPKVRRRRSAPRMAFRVRLEHIEIAELSAGPPPFGLRRLVTRELRLARSAKGRWRSRLDSLSLGAGQGAAALLKGIRWEGLHRKSGGLRTRKLRVAEGVVRVKGVEGAQERFSLRGDEVAPDLLEIRLLSPPGRATAAAATRSRRVDIRSRGLSVYSVVDGLKREARADLGGRLSLRHFSRFTRGVGVDLSTARLQGLFHVTGNTKQATLTTNATLTRVRIRRKRLAPRAVWWPRLGLKMKVRYLPGKRQLVLDRGDVTIADVPVRVRGTLTFGSRSVKAQLDATLPPTPCSRLFAAVPPELVPKLRGLKLGGRMGARLDVGLDSRSLEDLQLELEIHPASCRVLRDAPGARMVALRRPFTFISRPPGTKPTRLIMGPANPNWRNFNRLGRNVKAAFLAAEDRRFYQHQGFDLENIRRALASNLRQRHLLKGASSISQQVVKNVFLSHRRDISRKLQETILTWRMEQVLTKRRILEIYLNLVEMGPGLFGVRAAAQHYFQREPSHLNPLQAAHLAAVTPSPRRYFARFKKGRAGMDWLIHLRWLMYQMLRIGWIDRAAYDKHRKQDLRLISYQN